MSSLAFASKSHQIEHLLIPTAMLSVQLGSQFPPIRREQQPAAALREHVDRKVSQLFVLAPIFSLAELDIYMLDIE